jgi:two-component system response regulator
MNLLSSEILIVEDSATDLELAMSALRGHRLANEFHVARDGQEALDMLFGQPSTVVRPRLILLDLKLPKVDGFDVLRRIRADPRTHTVPVVVLTSSREDPDIERAYALGASSYIVKPVDFEQFDRVIQAVGMYWLVVNQAPHA